MSGPITEDDVFSNDVDPLEGIRQLRKEEETAVDSSDTDDVVEDTTNEEEQPDTDPVDFEDGESEQEESEQEESSDNDAEPDDTSEEQQTTFDPNLKRTFKANGQEFEFTQQEILDQFGTVFGKSVDYTNKTKKIAPFRRRIEAMEEEKITDEQFNLALDALKGNKQAIKQLMDNHNIESYDLVDDDESTSSPYSPTQYGSDEVTLNLKEVVSSISSDPEYSVTSDVVQNQWDIDSQNILANNPDYLQGLHNDIKTGLYGKVAPEATKLKILDGNTKSDIEYYILAGQKINSTKQANTANGVDELNKKTQEVVEKSDRASSEAKKKRAAASTGSRSDRTVIDYLDDDNDEAYEEWYKKTIASQ